MCVLCADLNTALHWSDVSTQQGCLRSRIQKLKVANLILKFYGLKLSVWGNQFILEDQKGRKELVRDLGDLCYKAQNLSNRPLDILDPDLLAFLDCG
ncbi:hypothetical protein [Helicobacter sp. NHP22-001]|uniref:hypothetical protein n=1 Tax=Helicobacter sp. NHP22-001 TaxID=3040202 RepID=UPI00244D87C8|nr:hypothetical protein [Helicobacter sp. NHP22-001]GMB96819.1 hypothetical protein NHP22001_14080 [Helicobacter sp. NHP22-001]